MPEALLFEFSGVTAERYRAVNAILGLDPASGDGAWPIGLLTHTAAAGEDGSLVVFEVWEYQDAQSAWMEARLGPALTTAGIPEPVRVKWFTVAGHYVE